jgi:hypothetical protein
MADVTITLAVTALPVTAAAPAINPPNVSMQIRTIARSATVRRGPRVRG